LTQHSTIRTKLARNNENELNWVERIALLQIEKRFGEYYFVLDCNLVTKSSEKGFSG